MIAGGFILALATGGGQLVSCGIRSGECTPQGDPIEDFADMALFFYAGGIGLVALGVFFLVPKQEPSKARVGKNGHDMIE